MREILLALYQCAEESLSPDEIEEAISMAEQAIQSVYYARIERSLLTKDQLLQSLEECEAAVEVARNELTKFYQENPEAAPPKPSWAERARELKPKEAQ